MNRATEAKYYLANKGHTVTVIEPKQEGTPEWVVLITGSNLDKEEIDEVSRILMGERPCSCTCHSLPPPPSIPPGSEVLAVCCPCYPGKAD